MVSIFESDAITWTKNQLSGNIIDISIIGIKEDQETGEAAVYISDGSVVTKKFYVFYRKEGVFSWQEISNYTYGMSTAEIEQEIIAK